MGVVVGITVVEVAVVVGGRVVLVPEVPPMRPNHVRTSFAWTGMLWVVGALIAWKLGP